MNTHRVTEDRLRESAALRAAIDAIDKWWHDRLEMGPYGEVSPPFLSWVDEVAYDFFTAFGPVIEGDEPVSEETSLEYVHGVGDIRDETLRGLISNAMTALTAAVDDAASVRVDESVVLS